MPSRLILGLTPLLLLPLCAGCNDSASDSGATTASSASPRGSAPPPPPPAAEASGSKPEEEEWQLVEGAPTIDALNPDKKKLKPKPSQSVAAPRSGFPSGGVGAEGVGGVDGSGPSGIGAEGAGTGGVAGRTGAAGIVAGGVSRGGGRAPVPDPALQIPGAGSPGGGSSRGNGATSVRFSTCVALPQSLPTGTAMFFSAEYRFVDGGRPNPQATYYWVIKPSRGQPVAQKFQLNFSGKLQAVAQNFKPDNGPFHCHMVEEYPRGNRRIISRSVPLPAVGGY